MKLKLVREHFTNNSTIGSLYIDDVFECHTLEDKDRKLETAGCAAKVDKLTCIPRGTYQVIIDMSTRFKRLMPLLVNVPCFTGIRIHSGNTAADTEGCIIVGRTEGPDWVGESVKAFNALFPKLQEGLKAGKVYITIE